MQRRDFITLVGGAAAAWPLVLNAQQPGTVRRVGVLFGSAEGDAQAVTELAVFTKALQELGWTEGGNIRIETRWAASDVDRMNTFAKELVGLRSDVIVGQTTQVVAALHRETRTTPIVFAAVADPVGSGFVASLPHPGGNVTGFINIEASLSGKWIEVLKEIFPGVSRVAILFNPDTAPVSYFLQPFEAAARSSAVDPIAAPVHTAADIERFFADLGDRPKTGVVLLPDIFTGQRANLDLIVSLAASHRVPTVYPYRYMVAAGGLISYGVDPVDLFRRAPTYVDRILKGANPADLPVQLPTKFEMTINLKTAKSLGLDVPATLLGHADEVIE
jgi:putative tryptophan/tyrosine transport system substrate-binding protein